MLRFSIRTCKTTHAQLHISLAMTAEPSRLISGLDHLTDATGLVIGCQSIVVKATSPSTAFSVSLMSTLNYGMYIQHETIDNNKSGGVLGLYFRGRPEVACHAGIVNHTRYLVPMLPRERT